MYTIAIDDNGYYKLGDGNLVEVNDIPNVYPLERSMRIQKCLYWTKRNKKKLMRKLAI